MRFRTSLIFVAAMALMGGATPAGLAEGQSPAPAQKFSLSAAINVAPQAPRNEMSPPPVAPPSHMMNQTASAMAMPPAQADSASIDGARLAALAAVARMAALQGQAEEDAPGAFMKEYNVDWSRWVSMVADRWFFVLRNSEHQLGVQFVTPRPALIQFTCYADGTIGNIILKQSSGVPAYDRLQVVSLLHAVPTPPFPAGTRRRSITLVQGWESHPRQPGEQDFQLGSFGRGFPSERVRKTWSGQSGNDMGGYAGL